MLSNFSFSDRTVGFLLEGQVNETTINRLILQIEKRWESYETIDLYLEDNNIKQFTLAAILNEVAFKFKNAHRFRKIALVTDRKWIKLCGALEDLFLSGEVRSYAKEDRLEAITWLSS